MKIRPEDITRISDTITYTTYEVPDSKLTTCWAFLPDGTYLGYGEAYPMPGCNLTSEQSINIAKQNALVAAKTTICQYLNLGVRLEGKILSMTAASNDFLTEDEILDKVKVLAWESVEYTPTTFTDTAHLTSSYLDFSQIASSRSIDAARMKVETLFTETLDSTIERIRNRCVRRDVLTEEGILRKVNSKIDEMMQDATTSVVPTNRLETYDFTGIGCIEGSLITANATGETVETTRLATLENLRATATTAIRKEVMALNDKAFLINTILIYVDTATINKKYWVTAHTPDSMFHATAGHADKEIAINDATMAVINEIENYLTNDETKNEN